MKITFLPRTKYGNLSLILTIISVVLFVIGSVLPALIPSVDGLSGWEMVTSNPVYVIITLLVFAAGIMAAVYALIAIIKKQERSVLVMLVILFGVYTIFSLIGVIIGVFVASPA